jgi:glycosyltransferase involved in cell wall biosynthesis
VWINFPKNSNPPRIQSESLAMKILLVHNSYQQPGGEDVVVAAEKQLLIERGHQVVEYLRDNNEIAAYGRFRKATLTARTVWAWDSVRDLRTLLRREKPDLAHFHNTFPLISPAAYYVCREAGVPVVQTLHNYRLLCPASNFLREGRACEDCLHHSLWRGILHSCYRNSRVATSQVALMLAVHRWLHSWTCCVDCFIALYESNRQKFIQGGIPEEKIVTKPNFVPVDPGCRVGNGEYAVYVGRLSPPKRVLTLLSAWQRLRARIPLRIAGSGPDREFLELQAKQWGLSDVRFLGQLSHDEAIALIKGARCLVVTSECYEAFGLVMIEAFACGVPVVCSRLENIEEVTVEGHTGLQYTPGDPDDLARKVEWAWAHPMQMGAMGRAARAEFEAKFTPECNYKMLMQIYQKALDARSNLAGPPQAAGASSDPAGAEVT